MKQISIRRSRPSSIRSRVLAIVLIPSIALLALGVALASYLVIDAARVNTFATTIQESEPAGVGFFTNVQEERRLTLAQLASRNPDRGPLQAQRGKTDISTLNMSQILSRLTGSVAPNVLQDMAVTRQQLAGLPAFRQRVDAGQVSIQEAYQYYSAIIGEFVEGLSGLAQSAPNPENAYQRVMAVPLFSAAEDMRRSDALAQAAFASGGLADQDFRTYVGQVGAYHAQLDEAVRRMIPEVKARYDRMVASPAWAQVTTVENAFVRGNQSVLPIPEGSWRASATEIGDTLMSLFVQQSANATSAAVDQSRRTLITSIIAGVAVVLVAIAAFVVALRLSNRLIARLKRLREDTLYLSDTRLPEIVRQVRGGRDIDLEEEDYRLERGEDEIGQVADAFNKAQQTAIAAAIEEAKTREGTSRVFLNIAHRSQVIVHRQLKVLDQAERKQEDPDQLDTLFKLDHLSTRARRNAENLIILGGGQPGRQWRNPVGLAELVRGAAAETEEFARVSVSKLPAIAVNGPVVGDLMHLLAELIDNATSFSPPSSRVEVRGNVVGRGAVIEIEDQGLGIEPEMCDELNAVLHDPPDFGIMALSSEPRLGLFVVARLAARHGISVTLRESAYGGTRAIVLVRSDMLSPLPEPTDEPPAEDAVPLQQLRRRASRHDAGAPTAPQPTVPATHAPAPQAPAPATAGSNGSSSGSFDPPTRQDLFRPPHQLRPPQQHEVRGPVPDSRPPRPEVRNEEARRRPAPPGPPAPSPSPGRPALPQRRRQQNLVPQLRNDGPGLGEPDDDDIRPDEPELARSRLAAFQQGTRRAREQDAGGSDDTFGERG